VPREDAIRLVGRVVDVLSDRLFRVELKNGHRLLAHASRRHDREKLAGVKPGSELQIEISPFDFSTGRIVPEERN
jgi:translation initiation factor IF-1